MQTTSSSSPAADAAPTRRILLCAIGMSPQIVTETLYALAVRPAPGVLRWIPTEVRIITTAQGAHNARLSLLSGQPGWFHQLRRDYDLPPIAFDDHHIHVVRGLHGQELDDIRTPADNDAAADQIAALVRDLTADDHSALHASLAGGRKTMSYYLGYALSLFGRAQDRLSHVLVSSDYESHPDFFYPTPGERIIHTREVHPRALDCRDAVVQLAEVPFLRLRDTQPAQALRSGAVSLRDAVRRANQALQPATVALDFASRCVIVNGEEVSLTPTYFALYAWMVKRHKEGLGCFYTDDPQHAQAFLDFVKATYGDMDTVTERLQLTTLGPSIRRNDGEELKKAFASPISRINTALRNALGELLAQRCQILSDGGRNNTCYSLPKDLIVR